MGRSYNPYPCPPCRVWHEEQSDKPGRLKYRCLDCGSVHWGPATFPTGSTAVIPLKPGQRDLFVKTSDQLTIPEAATPPLPGGKK